MLKKWQKVRENSQKIGFRMIVSKVFVMGNGKDMQADIVSGENDTGVMMIALTPKNEVIVARQFRCGPELVMDELPGGLVDHGESLIEACKRELLEETGYYSEQFDHIGRAYRDGWSEMKAEYFIAKDCRKVADPNPDEFEEIEVDLISIDQLIKNAKDANMIDIAGVFLAYDKLLEIKETTK